MQSRRRIAHLPNIHFLLRTTRSMIVILYLWHRNIENQFDTRTQVVLLPTRPTFFYSYQLLALKQVVPSQIVTLKGAKQIEG